MRLQAASLLVTLSTLLFTSHDSRGSELETPKEQEVVQPSNDSASDLIRARGKLFQSRSFQHREASLSQKIREVFDKSFSNIDINYITREFNKADITPLRDPLKKAGFYNSVACKFNIRHSSEDIVTLFLNFRQPEIIGYEKDPVKMAEQINEFFDFVNKDLLIKIPPSALVEIFKVLKQHNLFASARTPQEISEIIRCFNDKVFKFDKNKLPELLNCLLFTYYMSGIEGYKEKAEAMGNINDTFSIYNNSPENMQAMLNGLAWNEYIDGINEKNPKEIAKAILEKVKQYNFNPFISVMFVRNGVDPDYANEYLKKAKTKIPYDVPVGQLILFNVPLDFYLNHSSHDASVVIHDYNEIKIRELLKSTETKDIDKAIKEMKVLYKHFGLAFPGNYVRSYQAIKSMENAIDKNCKLDKVILYLLPGYEPGHDSSTRNDSAFMFSAFPIRDLENLGFTVIISSYENDFDIETIANNISGNYNCNPEVKCPLSGIVISGHGYGNRLYINDIPFDPGFDEKKHSSFVLDTSDKGIFERLAVCFKDNSPAVFILCSCSAASQDAKPTNLLNFVSAELPSNFLIQGPKVPTVIYGAYKVDELPSFIFDGPELIRGNKK